MFSYESNLLNKGIRFVAGIDEVGRGCLAGPMVIGCVLFDLTNLVKLKESPEYSWINDIKDSKKLSPKKRSFLAEKIKLVAHNTAIYSISNEQIDQNGISWAEKHGFSAVINDMDNIEFILTDAFKVEGVSNSLQSNIIGGDSISVTVAAASIIAKVHRDNFMIEQGLLYPKYLFEKNKGYGTKYHIETINKHGICNLHRKSFEPIKTLYLSRT